MRINGIDYNEFNFPVEAGITESYKPKITKVQYGDGYIQRAKKGINHNLREFSVTYRGSWLWENEVKGSDKRKEFQKVEDFLREHEGYKAFIWTSFNRPYLEQSDPIKVVCEEWTITREQGYVQISMTFKETL